MRSIFVAFSVIALTLFICPVSLLGQEFFPPRDSLTALDVFHLAVVDSALDTTSSTSTTYYRQALSNYLEEVGRDSIGEIDPSLPPPGRNSNWKMVLRFNASTRTDAPRYVVDDYISPQLYSFFDGTLKDSIYTLKIFAEKRAEAELGTDVAWDGTVIPEKICFDFIPTNYNSGWMQLTVPGIRMDFHYITTFNIRIDFDVYADFIIRADWNVVYDDSSAGFVIKLKNSEVDVRWWIESDDRLADLILTFAGSEPTGYEMRSIEDQKFKIFSLSDFGLQQEDSTLAKEILDSFPIKFTMSTAESRYRYERIGLRNSGYRRIDPNLLPFFSSNDDTLRVTIDFMEGPTPTSTAFTAYTPQPVSNPSFDHIGFVLPLYGFQWAFRDWVSPPGTDDLDRQTTLLNAMEQRTTQSVVIEFPWKKIVEEITPVSGLDPNQLEGSVLDTAVNVLLRLPTWMESDSVVARALRKRMDIIGLLVQGHTAPSHHVPTIQGYTMAPDLVNRGINVQDGVYYVEPNTYLYHLKVFAHAVVRRYRNDIAIWRPEAELNVARFNYLAGWYRRGSAWAEQSFEDSVWQILIQAIRSEDPSAKKLSCFHMLNLVNGIIRFGPDVDMIGINVYPNQRFATPVMGFAVGEMVWATRRALTALGMAGKAVYVTETNYPAFVEEDFLDPPIGSSIANDKYFSWGRQRKYVEDAINSCLNYGAKGFFWWGPLNSEEESNHEPYTNFGGLIKKNEWPLVIKPAWGTFQSLVSQSQIYPGKTEVLFANRITLSGGDLGGRLSLVGERDSVFSETSIFVRKNIGSLSSRTDQQYLQGRKHLNWDGITEKHHIRETFNVEGQVSLNRIALFASTSPFTITFDLSGIQFDFRDPWYINPGTGEQQNQFRLIPSGNYEVFLGQGDTSNLQQPYYSISAPLTAVSEFKGRFRRWGATGATVVSPNSPETAVIFNSPNAIIDAEYIPLVRIKVKPNILARTVTVDDTTFTGEREFEWEAGSQHTMSVPGPQYDGTNTRYLFSSWSDGGAQTHAITAPDPRSPSAAMHVTSAPLGTKGLSVAGKIQVAVAAESVLTYVATLAPQLALAVGVSPSYSGTTNISDTLWSVQGDTITVNATPEYGYSFASWSGDTTGSNSTIRIAMDRPRTITANFVWTLPPFTPELASPADSAMDLPVPTPLAWHWAKGATFYRVEISKIFNFSTIENYSETSDTSSIFYLFYGTKYYWRANARNNYGTSNWSTQRSFFTQSAPPPATRPAPSNAATNVLTTVSFAWDSTTGARTYQLQLSLVPNFTTLESNETEIPRNQCTIVGMLPNIQYYWRVRGINGADTSAWSSTWYFMTGSDVTWSTTWSGYIIVLKDYAVNAGVSLSISPGAFVKFAPGASLLINGTLTADGVSSQRITFDGSGYVPSDSLTEAWKLAMIRFLGEGKGSIQYADLQNANHQIFINRPTYIGGTSLVISNNTFKNFAYREPSNYAIRLWQNYYPLLIRSNTFEGALGTLKGNAIIAEFTGPYTVDWNTIRNCRIGVRLYSSWVGLCYNTIENTAYYGVQADMVSSGVSKFDDNHINYNGYGVFLNGASPYMSRNRISFNQNQGIYAGTQSSPQIGRNGSSPGQNVLRGNGIAGIMADNSSNPFMGGYSDPYVLGGYNSVYETVGGSAVSANAGSFVTAQWNYWASSTFSADSTCSIDTSHTLASDPNNGAYLSIRPPENFIRRLSPSFKKLEFGTIQSDEGAFKLALSLGAAKRFSEAKKILKDLTERSAGSKLGGFSLLSYREMVFAEILSDSTNQKRNGLKNELKSLLLSFKAREDRHPLRPLAMRMLARESVLDHDFTEAQNLNNEVISKYPESQWEKTALYDELMYSLSAQHNTPKAKEILSQMKRKYPNDELTKSARILLGDDVGLKSGYKRTEEASRLSQTKTEEGIPQQFALGQNHPNPFNPSTSFEFQLPSSEFVSIRVFDILGREVAMLVNGERAPGIYKFTWDASALPSGVYLYRMQAGRFVEMRKMVLAR